MAKKISYKKASRVTFRKFRDDHHSAGYEVRLGGVYLGLISGNEFLFSPEDICLDYLPLSLNVKVLCAIADKIGESMKHKQK